MDPGFTILINLKLSFKMHKKKKKKKIAFYSTFKFEHRLSLQNT